MSQTLPKEGMTITTVRIKIHSHSFMMDELPKALHYARNRIDDAIKVVVKMPQRQAELARR
jgi:hypothetical protein